MSGEGHLETTFYLGYLTKMSSGKTSRPTITPKLDSSVALQLWALTDAFERRLSAELASLGLSVAGFRLVGELINAPEGLRIGALAERLRVKAPTVSVMVDRFEAQGLVERIADPSDARAARVRLAAHAPLAHGVDVLARIDRALLADGSTTERTSLIAQLAKLTAALQQVPITPAP